jgi:hypothetical protein
MDHGAEDRAGKDEASRQGERPLTFKAEEARDF